MSILRLRRPVTFCAPLFFAVGLFAQPGRVSAQNAVSTSPTAAIPTSIFPNSTVPASSIPASAKASALSFLPPSCLLDLSTQAAAGKHGFMSVGGDGHFRFQDGTRARFWGINVSSTRLNIPNEQIEQVVANFAQAGLNMARLEAIDNRNCLLGSVNASDSQHFDLAYLDRLDYWMDCLRRHGLYYYVDLLDFRTFKTGDGVLNAERMDRGARPYGLFDRYLIQLQKEYASQLLLHKNRYSGLLTINDPALALVEICNEHGFFLYPEKLETMTEPYRSDLRSRWCQWLKTRYQTRSQLAAQWGQVNGVNILRDEEDPEKDTVELPLLTGNFGPLPANEADCRRAQSRVRDGVEFLAQLQRSYFKEMRAHLHTIGVRCPITAVVSNGLIPDIASVAQECDFTAENWYGEGMGGDPRTPGLRYYSNRNTVRDDSPGGFAPFTAALRWQNKPVVIREWATTWPNQFRAVSVPEALAYASLQDYDAVLLFGYQTNRAPNGAEADALNDFAFQVDPTTWGLYALAGQAFLKRAIKPADHQVTFTYPPDRLYAWPNNAGDLYRAAWTVRLNNAAVESPRANSVTPLNGDRDLSALRQLLAAIGKRGAPVSGAVVASHVWRSDTGQIVRNAGQGQLLIDTPTLCVLAGDFAPGKVYSVGRLRVSTQTPFGALFAYALDGRPLINSQHLIVKMVSRADNSGQTLEKAPPGSINNWVLRAPGKGPVLTYGRAATHPTRVWFTPQVTDKEKRRQGDKEKGKSNPIRTPNTQHSTPNTQHPLELLSLWMVDGTWEMEVQDGRVTLACDTPDINGTAQGRAFTTSTEAVYMAGLPGLPLFKTPAVPRPILTASAAGAKPNAQHPTPNTQRPSTLPSRSPGSVPRKGKFKSR